MAELIKNVEHASIFTLKDLVEIEPGRVNSLTLSQTPGCKMTVFAIDADEITMDSSFVDDLGADSVDLVELVMAMEEEFDIGEIEEEDLTGLKTVGDCVKYLTNKINN